MKTTSSTKIFLYRAWAGLLMVMLLLTALPIESAYAAAAITQRGTATSATSSTTSITINKPTGVISGDVMIVNISQNGNNTTAPSVSGWTLVASADLGGPAPARMGAVLYKVAGASEPASYTFDLGTGTSAAVGAIIAFANVDTSGANPFDVTPGAITTRNNTIVSATTLTTVSNNAAILILGHVGDSAATYASWKATSPSTLTELYDVNNSSVVSVGAAWAIKPTAGATGAGSANLSVSSRSGGILIALKPLKDPQASLTAVVTPDTVVYGSTADLSTTGGSGTGAVTFSAGASTGCSVSGTTLSVTNASGSCSITATKAGDASYQEATSAAVPVTLEKAPTTTTVTGGTFTYDAAAHAATVSVTGAAGLSLTPSPSYSGSCSAAPITVAQGTSCTASYTYIGDNNYLGSSDSASITINKAIANIVVTPYSVTYDGAAHTSTGSATGVGGDGALAGLDLSGTTHTEAGTYSGDVWSFTDVTGNYNDANGTVDNVIAKANATINVAPYSVIYDGVAHTSTGTATGVGGDGPLAGLDLSGTTHTEAGTYNNDPWSFIDVTGNYNNANGTVDNVIAKANATISVTGYAVTYDGTAHTATGSATGLNGLDLSSGLNLSATTHTAADTYNNDPWTFNSPNPNYNNASGNVDSSIAKANLTITGLSAADKAYDGNTTATLTGTATLVGVIGSDDVTLSGSPTAQFADPNVGLNKPVTVTGFTLSGAQAGNYTLAQPTGLTANINGASVTVTGITANNQVYDGNTSAVLNTGSAALVGVVSGDDVQLDTTSAAGTFTDKNVGTGKTVTVSGLTLTGADAGKYLLIQPTATADITLRDLSVTAVGVNKVYNGTTAATVTLSSDAVPGDAVTLTASATFADANVGTGKAISVTGISLGGPDAGNYNLLNTTANTTANITQAPLTVTANHHSKTVGQADPPFTFSYSGFVNGETSAVIDTPPTCDVSVPHSSAGTYPITCSGGADNNYSFSYVNGTLTVTSVTTVTFTDVPDTYWAWSFIERLYAAGITGGCSLNPLMYCPEGTVTRAQMAVFLERGIHGASFVPPAVGSSTGFGDVPTDYWAATYIKQLVTDGITVGCGGGNYCPENPVTRAQMAVFLLRSKHGASYVPPAVGSGSGFGDVPLGYWAEAFIKQLVAEGITVGCGNGNYCPEDPVTRAQMAVFLVRTFGLP